MRVTVFLLAVLLFSSSPVPFFRLAAQQPVFRSETRLIVETVTVKDKEGRAIEGLTAKDFAITEDGEPQQIAFVELQRLAPSAPVAPNAPIAPAAPLAPAAPVQTQISAAAPGDIRYRDRRLIIL